MKRMNELRVKPGDEVMCVMKGPSVYWSVGRKYAVSGTERYPTIVDNCGRVWDLKLNGRYCTAMFIE